MSKNMRIFDASDTSPENLELVNNIRVFFNGVGSIANIVMRMYASTEEETEVDGWVEVVIEYTNTIKNKDGTEHKSKGVLYNYDTGTPEPLVIKLEGKVMWNKKNG